LNFSKLRFLLQRLQDVPWLAEIICLLMGAAYALQGIYYAHHLDVTMDEGTYLMKGVLYLKGVYAPFEPYGPLTNKTPLAYFIPGIPQVLFEPGLRTGRYFSLVIGLLMLVGVWLAARQLGGRWWAVFAVGSMAANPANIIYYTPAITQVIVAAMTAWTLALSLGKERRGWELALGAMLAGLVPMARQNMIPLTVFVWLYILWEHGWKRGLLPVLAAAAVFVAFNLAYWPEIFQVVWTALIPRTILRWFITAKTITVTGGTSVSRQEFNWLSQLFVFWQGMRYNFVALYGAIVTWLLWPRRRAWHSDSAFKISVMLSVLLVVLVLEHFYASFALDYCLFCYAGYLAFFNPVGVLLVIAAAPSLLRKIGPLRQMVGAAVVVVSAAGIGFGASQEIHDVLMALPVPRVRGLRLQPGTTEVWRLLNNKFGWSYDTLQQVIPAAFGLLVGLAIVGIGILLAVRSHRRGGSMSPGLAAVLVFLLVGMLVSPTPVLGGRTDNGLCGGDVIAAHEAVGAHLRANVPEGALVYWENDLSPLPLLYIPNVRVFPPQLNHWYTFLNGGDPDLVYRKGYWNQALIDRWLGEADDLLIADKYVTGRADALQAMYPGMFDELALSPNTTPCRDRSVIHIFRRVQ
jgi:hypothetical protein